MLSTQGVLPQQAPRLPRKQLRAFKREHKARQYRAGHTTVDGLATGPDADVVRAACAKRDRKKLKRVTDAHAAFVGQLVAREELEGRLYIQLGDHVYTGLKFVSTDWGNSHPDDGKYSDFAGCGE